jgi:hypothetical protein
MLQIGHHQHTLGRIKTLSAEHNGLPTRQWLSDAGIGVAAHDEGMAHGYTFKETQIVWKVPKQLVVVANGPIEAYGYHTGKGGKNRGHG